jgi:hypothetical protein
MRPAGRKPHRQGKSASETTSNKSSIVDEYSFDIGTWLQNVPGLHPDEKELLQFLLGRPENLEYYVVSPSFQADEQRSLAALLPAALPTLKDAYLACAGALKSLQPGIATNEDKSTSLRYASSAMNTLRSLPVGSPQDAALCLTLGTVLASFVYSVVGEGVADICHHCLSITNPFMEIAVPGLDTGPLQSFLILLETLDCLVHRRKPTLRIQPRMHKGVDRRLGLCLPILPYYHDLCVISHSLANNSNAGFLALTYRQLDGIHASLEAWQPSHPDHFVDQYKSAEVISLLAQAKVYRLAGLLVSHRLRYVFDQEDGQADIWSKEIMMELELARQLTKRSIRSVTLPFVVAAIEVRHPGARIKALQNVDEYVDQFTPVVQRATKTFLERVWHERDLKLTSCWFDSASKPCIILKSIEATSFA